MPNREKDMDKTEHLAGSAIEINRWCADKMRPIYHVHTLVMHAKDTDINGIFVAPTHSAVCFTEMENFQPKTPNNRTIS